jgi:hypothetical protein
MVNNKTHSKLYGPFEVIDKIDRVAYRLNLPSWSMIHSVFHVSQLKKKLEPIVTVNSGLPLIGSEGQIRLNF